MLMVIFGAGASHDIDPGILPGRSDVATDRPPLSDQLFSNRYSITQARWSDFRGILRELRPPAPGSQLEGDAAVALEDRLQAYQTEADDRDDQDRRIQLAAVKFYLRDLAFQWSRTSLGSLDNNYVSLLERINHRRWKTDSPVALVSFNYDTLLEQALALIRHVPKTELTSNDDGQLSAYVSEQSGFLVLKPHGSWQWAREVTEHPIRIRPISSEDLIRNVSTLKFGGRYTTVTSPTQADSGDPHETALFPWLALPARSKAFAWPDSHSEALERCLAQVTHLIVIGWRGQEAHFLARWKAARHELRAIHLITGTETGATELQARLSQEGIGSANTEGIAGGFSGYIERLRRRPLDGFLSL